MLLNNSQSTHFNIANSTFSAIDLSLSSASIGRRLNWNVLEDLYNSDHFAIINEIPSLNQNYYYPEPRWKINKANWTNYQNHLDENIDKLTEPSEETCDQIDDFVQNFIRLITEAADLSIPETSTQNHTHRVPWWNNEVEKAIKEKKHAYNVYKKHKTIENQIQLKKLRAQARRKCKSSKRNSWIEYT